MLGQTIIQMEWHGVSIVHQNSMFIPHLIPHIRCQYHFSSYSLQHHLCLTLPLSLHQQVSLQVPLAPHLHLSTAIQCHDDVIKWKHFPRFWPVTGEFHTQRPVTRGFNVFFDLRLNNRFRAQSWGWWFETPSSSLWRHCNDIMLVIIYPELQISFHKHGLVGCLRNTLAYYYSLVARSWYLVQNAFESFV